LHGFPLASITNAARLLTGWTRVDPIVGAGIGLFIVPRTWILLKQGVHILMDRTPPEIDLNLLEKRLAAIPGVDAVHDLHVCTVTSGLDAMSCHLAIIDMSLSRTVLKSAQTARRVDFKLDHTTIQIEDAALRAGETPLRI
jgi:cobalt-zinc-cadmium efflux system protein